MKETARIASFDEYDNLLSDVRIRYGTEEELLKKIRREASSDKVLLCMLQRQGRQPVEFALIEGELRMLHQGQYRKPDLR